MNKSAIFCVFMLCMPAFAQDDQPWGFRLTPYLWFAGVKGHISTVPGQPVVPIDVSPSDAIDDTEASFMLMFEGKKRRHGFLLDVFYSDVRQKEELIPAIDLKLKSTSESTFVTGAYVYELCKENGAIVDVFGGARYWDVDTKLAFSGGLGVLEGLSVRNSESWVDPLAGIKATVGLGETRFFVIGYLAGGGGTSGGSDRFYDYSATVGYQWTDAISTSLGYRVFDVDYEDGSFVYDVKQEGWGLGLSWKF